MTNDNKIVLNAMKKAGIEIPQTKEEVSKLFDDLRKEFRKK